MRVLNWVLVVVCLSTLMAAPAAEAARHHHRSHRASAAAGDGVRDARYADFIVNPVTGEVYHQMNADERRYPASLTKMMTLYLLFEALDQHKTSLNARLDVSDYASTMPRTSLSLQAGDSVPVETAIKALIVLSANDVAIVVAEALGGDVDHFAEMMTAKAHALGMTGTVFQNPNGLPNSEQYTTARDMAKLGIALKRDFPHYYRYFQTRQFSWGGATYYTHNRVMLRYQGTDGIKTGFTGAAGFNLVTSVTRGGRPLVGVVLGGASGGWRDNRMIALLDASYKTIATRGAVRGRVMAANLPLPKNGVGAGVGISSAQAATEVLEPKEDTNIPEVSDDDTTGGQSSGTPSASITKPENPLMTIPAVVPSVPTPSSAVQVAPNSKLTSAVPAPAAQVPAKTVSPFEAAAASKKTTVKPMAMAPSMATKKPGVSQAPSLPPMATEDTAWGIQVGAFSTHDLAQQAAQKAVQLASADLSTAKISVAGPAAGGAAVHRARLENLARTQAIKACEKLISNNSPCFIYRAETAKP